MYALVVLLVRRMVQYGTSTVCTRTNALLPSIRGVLESAVEKLQR